MSRSKFSRRDMLRYASASSTLSFIPSVFNEVGLAQSASQSVDKPKLRSVIRLQMYAGWDVAMSVDPPRADLHTVKNAGKDVWMTSFNFPSGVAVDKSDLSFGNNAAAGVEKAALMDTRVKGVVGSEFFNNPAAGLRTLAHTVNGIPGKVPVSKTDFRPISGRVGSSGTPFAILSTDPGWTIAAPQNDKVKFGPLMHQFLDNIDRNPGGTTYAQTYLDYMTIINGIDTNNNVSHDFGDILAACGYPRSGVGNGADLTAIKDHNPTIECIMASQLIDPSLATKLRIIEDVSPAFVASLTFTNGGARRGYAFTNSATPYAQLFDMSSLGQLNKQTQLQKPGGLNQTMVNSIAQRMVGASNDETKQIVDTFKSMLANGGIDLGSYTNKERQAFDGMIEIAYEKTPLTVADTMIPAIKFRDKQDKLVTDFRNANPDDLRLNIDKSVERIGSFQANLATTARLVERGYSRGISVSFGGHNDFIPDTHWHNDHVQMIYQGIFWDGVRRLVNYLMWNNDESGQPLINTTLVIVTADILRGPSYFDTGAQGKSDYRNNSMVLIGGGLNHKTKAGSQTKAGRVIGYSFSSLNSGRINYDTGKATAIPKTPTERNEEKISFNNIYASLLDCYGMDKERYFKGVKSIGPIARNEPGDGDN